MNSHPFRLVSPLTPAECSSRLAAAIDTASLEFPWARKGTRPVIGRVTETSIELRKRIEYRNSLQSHLTATLKSESCGTVISGKVAMPVFVAAFLGLWFGGLALIGGTLFLIVGSSLLFGSAKPKPDDWILLSIPFLMVGLGLGMVYFGRLFAGDEAVFLRKFLMQTLDARDESSAVK